MDKILKIPFSIKIYNTSMNYPALPRFFKKTIWKFNNPSPPCSILPRPSPLKTISRPRWICVQNLGQIGRPAVLPWWWDKPYILIFRDYNFIYAYRIINKKNLRRCTNLADSSWLDHPQVSDWVCKDGIQLYQGLSKAG